MTVCLAALCRTGDAPGEGEPAAVVAADRMVTLGGFIEFEHAIPKMAHPTASAVALIAGDTLVGTRLAQDVADGCSGTTPKSGEIARALAQRYAEVRREQLGDRILLPRGLDMAQYYGAHASLNPQIVMMIDQQMQQHNLGVELLLAGVDAEGGHIFSVHNPGGSELRHDVIGYAAIGSGAIHALQSLIGFGHHSGALLHETVFRAYTSKRRAEVAPGVGHDTDLAIVTQAGITFLDDAQLQTLADTYDTYRSSTQKALDEHLSAMKFDLSDGAPA